MGRGSSKVSAGGGFIGSHSVPGRPDVWTAGEISFSDMMAIASSPISDGTVAFDRVTTVLPDGAMPVTGKKSDLGQMLDDNNMKRIVVDMYRDRSGANDLKRLFNLGFQIQAEYKGADTGSRVPPRDYYYMIRR